LLTQIRSRVKHSPLNPYTSNLSGNDELLLRDLIDTGDMEAFMNDVLVETKDKRKYNEIIEKVLRRIEENGLYIKLEKCI